MPAVAVVRAMATEARVADAVLTRAATASVATVSSAE
jgi:hypothetical protein